jgi:hypothetical protein
MRRLLLIIAALSLVVPVNGHAAPKTFQPPYVAGAQGGDTYNNISADASNGQMRIIRYYPIPTSAGLGCDGKAGFANFEVSYDAETPVKTVTIAYDSAIVDPYTWVNVGVRQGETYIRSTPAPLRGPLLGSGTITQTLDTPTAGPLTVWFGMQLASACPNIGGGLLTFTSVTFG